MELSGLSIIELKQLLARVNHDLKMNKPTIKRAKKIAVITESDAIICNKIASTFSGNKAVAPSNNDKLRADIAIQSDILDYLNNGGTIITRKTRKSIKALSIKSTIISL